MQNQEKLDAISNASAALLRARAEQNGGVEAAQRQLDEALRAAIGCGLSPADFVAADEAGRERARSEMSDGALKRIEKATGRVKAAERERLDAIRFADRLGLTTRQIAQAAGVTHITIRHQLERDQDEGDKNVSEPPAGAALPAA